jgi:hypothetical protein
MTWNSAAVWSICNAKAAMDTHELREKLNDISLQEFLNFRMSEEYPGSSTDEEDMQQVETMLRELGSQLTPALLDELELSRHNVTWSLRLSPYVPGDDAKQRAQRYIDDEDSEIHFYATVLLEKK